MFRFLLHPTSRASPRDTTPLNPPYILESSFSNASRIILFTSNPLFTFAFSCPRCPPLSIPPLLVSGCLLCTYYRRFMDIDEDETLKFRGSRSRALFYFPSLSDDNTRLEWQPGINDVSLREFLAWEFMAPVFQGENWNHGFQCHLCPMTSFMSRNVRIRWFFSSSSLFFVLWKKRNFGKGEGGGYKVSFRRNKGENLCFFCSCVIFKILIGKKNYNQIIIGIIQSSEVSV